jgi:hypothetical protein
MIMAIFGAPIEDRAAASHAVSATAWAGLS